MAFRRAEEEIAVMHDDAALETANEAKSLVKGFWAKILWPIIKEILIAILQKQKDKVLAKIGSSETIEVIWKG